jgi:hypothetical protein
MEPSLPIIEKVKLNHQVLSPAAGSGPSVHPPDPPDDCPDPHAWARINLPAQWQPRRTLSLESTDSRLGIGIITYNRLRHLKMGVERVRNLTRSAYDLVIADDGSSDGTREWCGAMGLRVVPTAQSVATGVARNRGIAWNKNRALYSLWALGCDPILLLEDDAWPRSPGWDLGWVRAGAIWHHVNVVRDWLKGQGHVYAGLGTPELPFHLRMCTGQCTVTSRRALEEVGFLDSRFVGYGWEHVEWSRRFGLAGYYGGAHLLSIYGGVEIVEADSWEDHPAVSSGSGEGQNKCNEELLMSLHERCRVGLEPVYRLPWRSEEERVSFLGELGVV